MQIIFYKPGCDFECRFRRHNFSMERDADEDWCAKVETDAGKIAFFGWIEGSKGYSAKAVFELLCKEVGIMAPKRWPKLENE